MNIVIKKLRNANNKKIIKYEMQKLNMAYDETVPVVNNMLKDFFSDDPKIKYDETEMQMLYKRKKFRETLKSFKKKRYNMKRDFVYYCWYPFVFKLFSGKPVNRKQALFVNDKFDYLPDNMQPLYDEFNRLGYKTITCLKPRQGRGKILRSFFRFARCTQFTKYFAQSGFIFLTEYYFPAYANKPREGTQLIQLWHACGAFKRWGYSTADSDWGGSRESLERCPVHNNYSAVMVSSPKVIPYYAEAFNCSKDIILPMGTPRTDIYFNKEFVSSGRKMILDIFPEIGDRKIILYAPTFRGNSLKSSFIRSMMDYMLLKRMLGDRYVLINKLHPLVVKGFSLTAAEQEMYGDFVFDVSKSMPIEKALCAADIVISDYSSLIFEYALLERPMIFFAYDLEDYDRARSFYFKYEDFVPGPIARDTMQIIDAVKNIEKNFDVERVRKFKNDFMSACDGHSTERIMNYILHKNDNPKADAVK